MTSPSRPLSRFDREELELLRRMKKLERIVRAAGLLCASFVFTEPRLTDEQERLAQRIRREVPKVLDR